MAKKSCDQNEYICFERNNEQHIHSKIAMRAQCLKNITTNEMQNAWRLGYLSEGEQKSNITSSESPQGMSDQYLSTSSSFTLLSFFAIAGI